MRHFAIGLICAFAGGQTAYGDDDGVANRINSYIELVDHCPGDKLAPDTEDAADESLIAGLLTPLIAAVARQGLQTIGEKLDEASKEKTIEQLHFGDYFYGVSFNASDKIKADNRAHLKPKVDRRYNCMIVVTAPKTDRINRNFRIGSEAPLSHWPGYQSLDMSSGSPAYAEDLNALQTYLSTKGYGSESRDKQPSSVAVFDIEYAFGDAQFRLVPRYFAVPHSPREGRADKRKRDFTFEVAVYGGGNDKPTASGLMVFRNIVSNAAYVQTRFGDKAPKPMMSTRWMNLPTPDTSAVKDIETAYKTYFARHKTVAAVRDAQKSAREIELQGTYSGVFEHIVTVAYQPGQIKTVCPDANKISDARRDAITYANKLQVGLIGKPEDDPLRGDLIVLRYAAEYFRQCGALYQNFGAADTLTEAADDNTVFTPFDVEVSIKEFRRRPVTEFFAGVLQDGEFQKGATQAIVDNLDPQTLKDAEEAAAKDQQALLVALDKAIVEANVARQNYLAELAKSDATDMSKEILRLRMYEAQRTANRAATAAGQPRPFVDADEFSFRP